MNKTIGQHIREMQYSLDCARETRVYFDNFKMMYDNCSPQGREALLKELIHKFNLPKEFFKQKI